MQHLWESPIIDKAGASGRYRLPVEIADAFTDRHLELPSVSIQSLINRPRDGVVAGTTAEVSAHFSPYIVFVWGHIAARQRHRPDQLTWSAKATLEGALIRECLTERSSFLAQTLYCFDSPHTGPRDQAGEYRAVVNYSGTGAAFTLPTCELRT
jgi:hypothetical protein